MIAFDECSVLHMAKVDVPLAFQRFYGEELKHGNCDKLLALVDKIKAKDKPYRFVPGLKAFTKVISELLEGGSMVMMNVFRNEIKISLDRFWNSLSDWGEISRVEDCDDVLEVFKENEEELTKAENIPEREDCEIIAGYKAIEAKEKILISEDEHFWGYKELIKKEFGIEVVEEWDCHKLTV